MKRLIIIVCVFMSLAIILSACGSGSAPAAPPAAPGGAAVPAEVGAEFERITIRVGNIQSERTTHGQALNRIRDIVESGSGGNITVDIFHDGVLGSERDIIQAIHEGSLELMFTGGAGIGVFVPAVNVFESWYVLNSVEQMQEAVEMMRSEIDVAFEEHGFKNLGAYFDGPRQMLTNRRIENFDDVAGLRLRVPGNPLYVDTTAALGMQPISMPLGDVYTSLQTGAIDGMEGSLDMITQMRFYEQATYLIVGPAVFQPLFIVYNLDAWNNLSPAAQELLQSAVDQSIEYQIQLHSEVQSEHNQYLQDFGIEFLQINDLERWVPAASEAAYEFAQGHGELGLRIHEVVQSFFD